MSRPLHEQQPTTRFSDRAAAYAKYRPGYPAEAIEAILANCRGGTFQAPSSLSRGGAFQAPSLSTRGGTFQAPQRETLVAADIGAGTGIAARLLAKCGVRVFAIEPNGPNSKLFRTALDIEHSRSVSSVVQLPSPPFFESFASFSFLLFFGFRLAFWSDIGSASIVR